MSEWKSIYFHKPKDCQVVMCRRSGESGCVGSATYNADKGVFTTTEDKRNRIEITIWKCDEWKEKED